MVELKDNQMAVEMVCHLVVRLADMMAGKTVVWTVD